MEAALDQWTCERCTWNNTASDLTCSMCYQGNQPTHTHTPPHNIDTPPLPALTSSHSLAHTPYIAAVPCRAVLCCAAVRVSTKDAPVIWQWSTGHEWIPYDLDTTLALESAYQQHQPALPLTHGYFAANTGYTVTFRGGGGRGGQGRARHVQTNQNTGMRRQVRRIAEDDEELFKPVSDDERRQAGRCSVCQLELEDNETGDEQADEATGADNSEQSGGGNEAVSRAASRQVSGVRKSGSTAVSQPVQPSASNAATSAAAVTATNTSPATTAATVSTSSSSSADRIVRLAHCAPGHGTLLSRQSTSHSRSNVCRLY